MRILLPGHNDHGLREPHGPPGASTESVLDAPGCNAHVSLAVYDRFPIGSTVPQRQRNHSPGSVSVLISRLRHKFTQVGASQAIDTVRGTGYRLHFEEQSPGTASSVAGPNRELRDASWRLQEALIEIEHSGTAEQQQAAVGTLNQARRSIYASLAE
ncbi:MAG: helix-turn-helix domain-containing protein [Actinomycetota bacterium]|nr:helix-turn-helix domain-containing protein [Actinomycetota bacterium]MDZ4179932.1 helix-turn-helix domain-containing protein [Coriobacteriia bacterium]